MDDDPANPALAARREQILPTLREAEVARMRAYGDVRRFRRGERLVEAGTRSAGMFVILSGHVGVSQRDGLGHVVPLVRYGPGQFMGEVGQLSGKAALVDGVAEDDVEALLIPPERLRALIVAEADLGERIVRALILRRAALIESGRSGPVLIGAQLSPDLARLQTFLRRNGHPYQAIDPATDEGAALLFRQYGAAPGDVLVVLADGSMLVSPPEDRLAAKLGLIDPDALAGTFDVAIVGAGPAGLSTAVYAASEGLRVAVLDCRAFGGQAGASARIENYLGFPTGISGQALAGRAFVQAQKFGAEILIPAQARSLQCPGRDESTFMVGLADGRTLEARTVVVASGAAYRRLDVPRIRDFESRGVWCWASAIEAKVCAQREIAIVGAGNSAGQAAVFLAGHASKVHMLVRGDGLAATMSRYLIDRIAATPTIEVHVGCEVTELHGEPDAGLRAVSWRDRRGGEEHRLPIANLFLFIGAEPETAWLGDCVKLDAHGFVLTGEAARVDGFAPAPLEATVPGVFAVGDVRAGSVKRVGAAIGEGAAAVAQIHQHLAGARARRSWANV